MKSANCPVCTVELVEGHKMLYETLSEHVCDPNGNYPVPKRGTWVCPNPECMLCQTGWWSNEEGAWYSYYTSEEILMGVPQIFPILDSDLKNMGKIRTMWNNLMCWMGFHKYTRSSHDNPLTAFGVISDEGQYTPLGYHSTCKRCGHLDIRWKIE